MYESDYYDNCRKCTTEVIWKSDEIKLKIANRNGYKLVIVWQSDWETDNIFELNKLIKIINNEGNV